MFRNISVKAKFFLLIIIQLTVILTITGVSIYYVNNINDTLKGKLYDEGFKSISLILNADRDMYQALCDLQAAQLSSDNKTQNMSDYQENIGQVKDRVSKAKTILSGDQKGWSFQEESTRKTVFELMNNFSASFDQWTSAVSNSSVTAKSNVDKFDDARNYLDIIGQTIETGINNAMVQADKNKNRMITTILIIDLILLIAFFATLTVLRYILKFFKKVIGVFKEMTNGSLDITMDVNSNDEIGIITKELQGLIDNMNLLFNVLNDSAKGLAQSSKQVSSTGILLSQGATQQASSIEELTASIEEIASKTKLNAVNANKANELAQGTKESAKNSTLQMKQMVTSMEEINEASHSIHKIIKVIDEIAFQTNILALNASVEAARAGTHGKGFAVVAEEVRNLATRSADAARETTEIIQSSIQKIINGTDFAKEADEELDRITERINQVSALVNEIFIASDEQASGLTQINQGITHVSQIVQTNSATSEESAAASHELASQAHMLNELIGNVKLKKNVQNNNVDVSLIKMNEINEKKKSK